MGLSSQSRSLTKVDVLEFSAPGAASPMAPLPAVSQGSFWSGTVRLRVLH